jgi:hypothetical protein
MDKSNISVIIQGPIDDRTYESIDSYSDQGFGEIIVSTWEDEDFSLLEKTNKEYILTTSAYPKHFNQINNQGSRFFQAFTTWKGCLSASKQFVLRTRSDEIYPDLSKFVDNWSKYPDRIHTTNNGFWKKHNLCFSSHMFGAQKEVIEKGCALIVLHSEKKLYPDLEIAYPEQCFGIFFMFVLGHNVFESDWKKIFYDNVFITPCSDLPGHLHSGQTLTSFNFKRVPDYPNNRKDYNEDVNSFYSDIEEFIS